jgi:hypothetical protein
VAIALGFLSFVVAHNSPKSASLHPRPAPLPRAR